MGTSLDEEFDLQPCRFCRDPKPAFRYAGLAWFVKCENEKSCGISGPKRLTQEDAAAAWNITPFQRRVSPWLFACMGETVALDKTERNDRFGEEALEVLQAAGCSRERMHALVDYVCDKEKGHLPQEIGGALVTLASLAIAHGLDMNECGETELARILDPVVMEKIRNKQKTKPTGDALLESYKETIRVPLEPTEEMWGGLARQIVMWMDMDPKTPRALFQHLKRSGYKIPKWLSEESEMKNLDHTPSKGTRAVLIYKAMIHSLAEKDDPSVEVLPPENQIMFVIEHNHHFVWVAEKQTNEGLGHYMTHDINQAKQFDTHEEADQHLLYFLQDPTSETTRTEWSIVPKKTDSDIMIVPYTRSLNYGRKKHFHT